VASEVLLGVEDDRLGRVNVKKLLKVKDLNAMTNGLGSDNDIVLVCADLAPLRWLRVLGKTAKIDELALLVDFRKGGTIILANGNELAAIIRGPTPRRRATSSRAAKSSMAQE
jgi:hypothetical protein